MALIPPSFVDSVVAIGVEDEEGDKDWSASGFLYGFKLPSGDQKGDSYLVYLVTNRHVFAGREHVTLRFNPQANESAKEYKLELLEEDGSPTWSTSPNAEVDVAVVPVNFPLLREEAMRVSFFESETHAAGIDQLNRLGTTEGDFVYVLGFPMGMVGPKRNTVIVRGGVIARIRDTLARESTEFLVDAFVFPGNSGGPIVSKPEVVAIEGTDPQRKSYLIGIVKSYVTYRDVAVSSQSGMPRVTFEENSGLAVAHPVDYVREAALEHMKKLEDVISRLVGKEVAKQLREMLSGNRRDDPTSN